MSRLLLLAGTPPLPALEARSSYPAYEGCYSLDTTTAASVYNLNQSDPPTCAATCGDEYPYTAILAQFCFCFPSPPDQATTYNDSACSINCDTPYQDESCGGITPGTLIDLYSYYAASNADVPYGGDDYESSSIVSPMNSVTEPVTTYGPSTDANNPTAAETAGSVGTAESPTPTLGTSGGSSESLSTGTANEATAEPTAAGSDVPFATKDEATITEVVTTVVISTYTVTLWTTVTSYTTVYPGGPLEPTLVSSPTAITSFTAQVFTSSHGKKTITVPCGKKGAVTTSVLPGSVQVVAYNPYESEVREVLETEGTKTVLAAVVVARTASDGLAYETSWGPAGNGSTAGQSGYGVPLTTGLGQSASVTGGQGFNGSVVSSTLLPVTAGAGRGAAPCLSYFVAVVMLGAAVGMVVAR